MKTLVSAQAKKLILASILAFAFTDAAFAASANRRNVKKYPFKTSKFVFCL